MLRVGLRQLSFLGAGVTLVAFGTARPAHADESCTLKGKAVLGTSVAIFDAPTGGTEIAHFTGAEVDLAVTAFPESAGGRAAVRTTGFRIQGFVRARDLSVFTVRSVPTYAGHVWIADARRVTIMGAAGGRLHVEKSLVFPMTGHFHGWAPCDSFSLNAKVPSGWAPPGNARGYVVKKDRIELHSEPKGDVVTSIERSSDGPGVLLWSVERQGAWLHVEHHGDVILDGWVRAQDVSPLPAGETMDQLAAPQVQRGAAKLSVQGTPKAVRATREVLLRAAASDASGVLGAIETDTEVLVLDVVAGWASVVPKSLTVAPSGSGQFWAKAKELGL